MTPRSARSLRRFAAVLIVAVLLPAFTTACFGRFALVRKVYGFNQQVSSDKWVRWLVFLGLTFIPVYGFSALFDAIFANSVEFWTGDNPVTAVPGTTRTIAGANGEEAQMTLREDGAIDVVIRKADGREERWRLVQERESVAMYDETGLLFARVGDGPAGVPTLLGPLPPLALPQLAQSPR